MFLHMQTHPVRCDFFEEIATLGCSIASHEKICFLSGYGLSEIVMVSKSGRSTNVAVLEKD